MARRTPPVAPVTDEPDEAYLAWRFSWLVRSNLLAPGYPEIGREAARLRGLPIEEAVVRLEEYLAARGLLTRAERLIQHLISARAGWAANEATRRSTTRRN